MRNPVMDYGPVRSPPPAATRPASDSARIAAPPRRSWVPSVRHGPHGLHHQTLGRKNPGRGPRSRHSRRIAPAAHSESAEHACAGILRLRPEPLARDPNGVPVRNPCLWRKATAGLFESVELVPRRIDTVRQAEPPKLRLISEQPSQCDAFSTATAPNGLENWVRPRRNVPIANPSAVVRSGLTSPHWPLQAFQPSADLK